MYRSPHVLLALLIPTLGCGDPLWHDRPPVEDEPVELERGVLSAPSADAPAVIAQRFAAGRSRAATGELAVKREQGGVVTLAQRHAGREVVGGSYAVRVGDDGVVRWARDRRKPLPPDLAAAPALTADVAEARARAASDLPAHLPARVEEVIYALAGPGRLAYRVRFARDPETNRGIESYVDATTGDVLHAQDLVLYDRQARVYPENPWTTPELTQVTLDALPAGATVLADADFDVRTCVDEPTCTEFESGAGGSFYLNLCELKHLVSADASGDFFVTPPEADTEVEDPFAEVQLYFALQRAVTYFRSIGATDGLRTKPMLAIANYRDDAWLCEGPTTTGKIGSVYNNAFFAPDGLLGHPGTADTVAFGNGNSVDYAWDSDVVTHELAHALVHTVSDLGRYVPTAQGIDHTPAAMHEGLADYFAIARADDPELAEWVGVRRDFSIAMRDLRTDRVAWRPEADPWPIGAPHDDGMVIAGALWDIRDGLSPADRPKMDAAVLAAVSALGADDTFATTAPLLVAEIEAALGETAAASAETILAARGVSAPGRVQEVVPELASENSTFYWWVVARPRVDDTPAPNLMQWTVEVTETVPRMTFAISEGGCEAVGGYLKAGAPVSWDFAASPVSHDADAVKTIDLDDGQSLSFEGPFAPGTYHLQLENLGGASCELVPVPIATGSGDAGFVTSETVGGGSPSDNACDVSAPADDPDCRNNVCEPELAGDPDCPDGVCEPELVFDPDCECGGEACVGADDVCTDAPGDPDCVLDGECSDRIVNDPDCAACVDGGPTWPGCLEDGACDEANEEDDPDCDEDEDEDSSADGEGGGGCAAGGPSTGSAGLALALLGLARARRRRHGR